MRDFVKDMFCRPTLAFLRENSNFSLIAWMRENGKKSTWLRDWGPPGGPHTLGPGLKRYLQTRSVCYWWNCTFKLTNKPSYFLRHVRYLLPLILRFSKKYYVARSQTLFIPESQTYFLVKFRRRVGVFLRIWEWGARGTKRDATNMKVCLWVEACNFIKNNHSAFVDII